MAEEQVIKLLEEIRDLQKLDLENSKEALKNQQESIRFQKRALRRQKLYYFIALGVLFVMLVLVAWPSK
jgi:Mg2+/citrate symporter